MLCLYVCECEYEMNMIYLNLNLYLDLNLFKKENVDTFASLILGSIVSREEEQRSIVQKY